MTHSTRPTLLRRLTAPRTHRSGLLAFFLVTCATLIATLPLVAHHSYISVNDVGGVDDAVGQADMTRLAFDGSHAGAFWVKWTWDRIAFTGNNTGDACVLFDTDGDMLVNNSLCVQIGGNPATLQATYPRLFSCNESSNQKCGGSTAQTFTGTCSVSIVTDGPFAGNDNGATDAEALCEVPLSNLTGTPIFTTVCSYPSAANGGNNDPSDCIVSPGTQVADVRVSKTNGVTSVRSGATTTYTIVVSNAGPSHAPNTTVQDPAVAGLTKTSVSCSAVNATCPAGLTVAQLESGVSIPTLSLNGSITLTVTASVTATSGSVANTATVTAPAGFLEPDTSSNSATDTDAIAGIVVTPTSGLVTTEANGTATFTVVLISAPSGNVTIPLSSSNTAEGTVGATSITFTPANWNVPQTVTVTGVDDPVVDGTVAYTIVTGAATSTDTTYGGMNPSDVSVANLDNDAIADLAVAKTNGVSAVNAGSTTSYTVTVSNAGPSAADGATVVDGAAAGLTKTTVSCTAAGGAVCPASSTIAALEGAGVVIPTLPSGGAVTLTVGATVTATGGSVANTVSVTTPAGTSDPSATNNSVTDTDAVTPVASLSVTKTDGVASIASGASTSYTIVVANAGPSAAGGTLVSDPPATGVTKTGVTCAAAGGAACPASLTIPSLEGAGLTIATLPSGGSVSFTVAATITAASGLVTNTTSITPPGGTVDPAAGDNTAADTNTVNPVADLTVTKSNGGSGVTAGGSTTYSVTLQNSGPSQADGAVLADPVTAGLTVTTANCSATGGASCPAQTGAALVAALQGSGVTIPTLPNGGAVTVTMVATIAAASGTVANTATATPPAGVVDPNAGNSSATDTDPVTPAADLSATITDGVTSVTAGGTTTYTVVVANSGPSAATGAALTVTAPAGVTFGAWTCVATGGAVCPTSGSGNISTSVNVPAGGTLTFTVPASVAPGASGTLTTTAAITVPGGVTDPNGANNSATDVDGVGLVADLAISKSDGAASVNAGGTTTYTIVVANNGSSAADAAIVTDLAVAGLTKTSVGCVAAGGAVCPATLTIAALESSGLVVPTLPNGGSVTLTVGATVTATSGSVANGATVTTPGGVTDPSPANNASTDTNSVTPVADLSATITDGVTNVTAGGTTTYTVVIANSGPSAADGATATVNAPAGLSFTSWTCVPSGGAVCPASGGGNIASAIDVPSGGSVTYTIVTAIGGGVTPPINTTVTVGVPSGVVDPNPANNAATDIDGLGSVADLSIAKSNAASSVSAGGTTTYTITFGNAGPSPADGALLMDAAVAGIAKTAVSCTVGGGAVCPAGLTIGQLEAGVVVPTLPSGGSLTVTVTATISATSGSVSNVATLAPPAGTVDPVPANNSATDTDAVGPVLDLSVTVNDGVVTLAPGGITTYTVVVANAGPSGAASAPLTVTAPAGLTFGAWTCVAAGGAVCPAVSSGNINTLVSVPAGGSLTFSMPAAVAAGASGSLSTVATVAPPAGTVDPNPANNSATDIDAVGLVADLTATVSDGVTSVAPGGTTTYTVAFGNNGPSAAVGATIAVPLPTGVTPGAWTCVASGGAVCPPNGSGALAATVDLPAGSTLTFTMPATVSASAAGSVSLVATVTPPAGVTDPAPANNNATDTDTVIPPTPVADLAVTKTNGATNVAAGGTTIYTVVVSNAGPDVATGAVVTDAVATGLNKTSVTCAAAGGASCPAPVSIAALEAGVTLPALPSGATVTFTVTAQVTATTGSVTNTVTVAPPAGVVDPTNANNAQSDTDAVMATTIQADLGVAIADATAVVTPGGVTTYTIAVTNAGPAPVTGATLTSVAPAMVIYGAWTCAGSAGGSCPPAGAGSLSAPIDLPVGATVTFVVSASVASTASGTIVAAATVSVPTGVTDANPANDSATDSNTVTVPALQADLSITKTNGTTGIAPGASTVYTIIVTNAGPAAVSGAVVRDAGNSGLTIGAWTCVASAGATCAASGTGPIDTAVMLPAGGQATFTVAAIVGASVTGAVTNTAMVTAPAGTTDPNAGNNSATDSDNVPSQRIAVAKEAGEPLYVAPFTFEVPYTIRVENVGSIPATNVQVTDSLADAFVDGRPTLTLAARASATGIKGATAAQCVSNGGFNGTTGTQLLTGTSTLAPGQACEVTFRVRVAYADQAAVPATAQLNLARAATYQSPGSGLLAEDDSDSGKEPATSNPGAPGDTGTPNDATPVQFAIPRLDITKAVTRVEQIDDTTFELRYVLRLKNTSSVPARNVQVIDDLVAAFSQGAPAISVAQASPNISLAASPSLEDGEASLTLAAGAGAFNGVTQTAFLTGEDVVPPGQGRTIAFTVRLRYPSTAAIPVNKPLRNLAIATSAASPGGTLLTVDESSDVTSSGAEPTPSDEPSVTIALLTPKARLTIVKVASAPLAEVGDSMTYAIRITNNGGPFMPRTILEDRLPLGFSYIDGSARLTLTGSATQAIAEPQRSGSLLAFVIPAQPAIGEVMLTYRLRVGVGAQQGDGVNRAIARAEGGIASNESLARVVVRGGVFTDDACVIGRVFVDLNGNRLFDAEDPAGMETGVPGARVVLEDGTTITTDGGGNYSTCGLRPGTHVVKIDPLTLPAGAALVAASNRQAGDADTMFLDLKFGELRRADFIMEPATSAERAALLAAVQARRDRADRGLLPPDWSGGINGSMVSARGAGQALPGGASVPAAGGFVAGAGTAVRYSENATGHVPTAPEPYAVNAGSTAVGRIELAVDETPVGAESPVRMTVRLLDPDGRPVQGTARVRVELAGASLAGSVAGGASPQGISGADAEPVTRSVDARVPETGTLVEVVDGAGVIEIAAVDRARDVQVRATVGLATVSGTLSFPTPRRPMMAVGVVEGLLALTHVRGDAMTPAQPGDVFDRELREFSRTLGDDGVVGARGAMYLRGTVKGDYLMTMAYDSERRDRGVLFRDIQPDAFYPVYGDASVKTFDAQTSGRFYLRVERGRSYLLYGDLLTAAPAGEARNLGTYSRTLTGLQQRIERGRAVVNLFASRDTLRQVIDEVSGRGISGPYSVSNANGVSGTEKVEIVTRDRNQPAIVLSATPLTRFVDYEFEPFSGRVLFRKPVPSMDERLNPVSVRITYEVDGGGERHWVDGADGQVGIGRFLSVGGSLAQDHNPYAPFDLASGNVVVRFNPSTTFLVEGAQTTSTLNTSVLNRAATANLAGLSGEVTGAALRAELRHESSRAQLRVYFGDSDPAFNNPSASLTGGRSEAGARGSWRLSDRWQLRGEAMQSKDRLTGGERRGGLLALESRLRWLTLESGLRTIHETATPVSPVSVGALEPFGTTSPGGFGFAPSAGAIDPVTGMPVVSTGATPLLSASGLGVVPGLSGRDLDATTVRAQLTARMSDRLSAYGEAEQDVSDADKHMAAAGGEFRISERGRVYGRHEFISSLGGIYALNEASRAQRTVFGLSTGYMRGGDVFSEYRMRDAMTGREAQAAVGLRNAWTLTDGVRLSTGLERLNPLRGTASRPATAASIGLEHTRSRDLKASGRVEWRREGDANSWLSTVGAARRLSSDWTLLAKNYFQLMQPAGAIQQRQNRFWIGTAYRDQAHNRLNALSRYELRLEQLPTSGLDTVSTDRRVQIVSTHADYHPAPAWNVFGQYAAKWVREQFDGAPARYSAHLAATRATYDVTKRIDVGAMLSLLYSPAESRTRTALGGEVGAMLRDNTWLSFGYNVTGFSDRDLREMMQDGYTTRGAYLRLRVKFDEDVFRRE